MNDVKEICELALDVPAGERVTRYDADVLHARDRALECEHEPP